MKQWSRNTVKAVLAVAVLIVMAVGSGRAQTDSDRPDMVDRRGQFDETGMILAQVGPPGGPGPRRGMGKPPLDSGGQRRHIEQLRMLKLLEALDLSEEQEPKFLMAFKGMRKAMRELDDRKQGLIEKLSGEIKSPKPDDRKITGLVDSVMTIEAAKRDAMRNFVTTSRSILTPVQVGRLLVFTERFEFELLERVREFRERMRNEGPAPRGADDGQ